MAVARNPQIVTANLMLYYDTANQRSYSNSTVVRNLTEYSTNATFANSSTTGFVSNGIMDVISSNDAIITSNSTVYQTPNFTVSIWLQNLTDLGWGLGAIATANDNWDDGWGFILTGAGVDWGGYSGVWINHWKTGPQVYFYSNTITPATGWHNYIASYDQQNLRIYVDGVQINSYACTTAISYEANTMLCFNGHKQKEGPIYYSTQSNAACCMLYNRALTNTEIMQNFNALRPRFGV